MASQSEDVKSFFDFLKSLWAILAQVSILFPLSSKFLQLIPVEPIDGDPSYPFYFVPPILVPMIATLCCGFVILLSYNQRHLYRRKELRSAVLRKSILSLAFGLFSLAVYLVQRQIDVGALMAAMDVGQYLIPKNTVKFFVDVILLLVYTLFFILVTRAFMLQAIVTYYGRSEGSA